MKKLALFPVMLMLVAGLALASCAGAQGFDAQDYNAEWHPVQSEGR